jgi:hypothetical protein
MRRLAVAVLILSGVMSGCVGFIGPGGGRGGYYHYHDWR